MPNGGLRHRNFFPASLGTETTNGVEAQKFAYTGLYQLDEFYLSFMLEAHFDSNTAYRDD